MIEHKTHIKLRFVRIVPMSDFGFERWGNKQREHISRHRLVFKSMVGTHLVPADVMRDNNSIGRYLCPILKSGKFNAHGWGHGKTKTHIKWTKRLFTIEILDADTYKYIITNTRNLNHYWFRKKSK